MVGRCAKRVVTLTVILCAVQVFIVLFVLDLRSERKWSSQAGRHRVLFENQTTPKALIIYEDLGSGHRRLALIIREVLAERGYSVQMAVGSEFFQQDGLKLINNLWNSLLARNMIRTADFIANIFIRSIVAPFAEVALTTNSLLDILDGAQADLIISTADGYSKLLSTFCKLTGIPLVQFLADISVFQDQVNPYIRHLAYFPETCHAVQNFDLAEPFFRLEVLPYSSFIDRVSYVFQVLLYNGLLAWWHPIYRQIAPNLEIKNNISCCAVGPIVGQSFFANYSALPIIHNQQHAILNISDEKPCILIASGSIGGAFVEDAILAIKKYCPDINITIIAMHGRSAIFKVMSVESLRTGTEVYHLGYVDNFADYLSLSDVLIARPSAGVFLESLSRRVPMIMPRVAAINDKGSMLISSTHQLGELYSNGQELALKLKKVLENQYLYVRQIERYMNSFPQSFESMKQNLAAAITLAEQPNCSVK